MLKSSQIRLQGLDYERPGAVRNYEVGFVQNCPSSSRRRLRSTESRKSQIMFSLALFIALQNQPGATGWRIAQWSTLDACFVSPCRPRVLKRHSYHFGAQNSQRKSRTKRKRASFSSNQEDSRLTAVSGSTPSSNHDSQSSEQQQPLSPIPVMPSPLFVSLAQSQLELLAHSLPGSDGSGRRKIGSMALYLPQENMETGQLEFVPAVLYPHPSSERVFIASDADSGMPPTLPQTLTKLPGFAHAATLLPSYPMVSSSGDKASAGVGVVEEVMCDIRSRGGAAALSVPLFSGSRTVGVLLVRPSPQLNDNQSGFFWTKEDKEQISRAAQSLSLALSMDVDRADVQNQVDQVRVALSDSLHQVKNPLQALRTFGKLLQQRVANTELGSDGDTARTEDRNSVPQLLALAQHLMVQSDRVSDLLLPMDSLVNSLDSSPKRLYLNPAKPPTEQTALTPWRVHQPKPWSEDPIEFGANESDIGQRERGHEGRTETPRNRNASVEDFKSQSSADTLPQSKLKSTEIDSPTALKSSTLVGDEELEMSFITDVLEPILAGYRAIASERGIRFEVLGENEELPGVLVCPRSLQEAVSNVLDNAFKYVVLTVDGARNPTPFVNVRLMANREPYAAGVTIFIEDNGPGIRPQDREAIFERGFRSGATSSIEGTGIGLDISRSLLSRMGGLLDVAQGEPETQCGTVMKLVLFRQPELP